MKRLFAVIVGSWLSFGWLLLGLAAEKVPDLGAAIRQYKTDNQEKYDQLNPETKAILAKAKEQLAQQVPNPGLPVGEKAPNFTQLTCFEKVQDVGLQK